MKSQKRQIGDVGEGVACRYLESKGYKVLERNYLKPWGEIDIVAERSKRLYFIEVKSVRLDSYGKVSRELMLNNGSRETDASYRPEDNVHEAKLKRLHRAIQTYLMDRQIGESVDWQLDVACVYLDFSTKKARVEMLENVIL